MHSGKVTYNLLYLDSFKGIVYKNIQSSILFFTNFIKQLLDFFINAMVTLNWDALASTLLANLCQAL